MRDFDWQIIVTLHKTGSITKTAEILFITQPALTKRIQAIEDELGVTLILRSRRGSSFTPEGERIAQKAIRIAASIQEAKDLAAANVTGDSGILRLGFPYSFVRYVLPEVLKVYSGRYPDVNVDIHTMQSADLIRCVEDGVLDLCFSRYISEDTLLEHRLFSNDHACIICGHPFELGDLPNMPYIEYPKNMAMQDSIQRWWNEHFVQGQNTRYQVGTSDACISMVQHGIGFGITMDERCMRHETGLYAHPMELVDGTKLTKKTWLMFRKESVTSPLISNFLAVVESIGTPDLF